MALDQLVYLFVHNLTLSTWILISDSNIYILVKVFMDLFHGFHDYEVGDSVKNAEILSNILESLSEEIDKEKVNKISLISRLVTLIF